jgi:hypothetical protein
MNADRLIEECRRQGRVLEVEGANTVLWRMGQGVTWGSNFWLSLSKLLSELAGRRLEGATLDLPGLGLAGRPADFNCTWSGLATWYLQAIDAAGIRNFHFSGTLNWPPARGSASAGQPAPLFKTARLWP